MHLPLRAGIHPGTRLHRRHLPRIPTRLSSGHCTRLPHNRRQMPGLMRMVLATEMLHPLLHNMHQHIVRLRNLPHQLPLQLHHHCKPASDGGSSRPPPHTTMSSQSGGPSTTVGNRIRYCRHRTHSAAVRTGMGAEAVAVQSVAMYLHLRTTMVPTESNTWFAYRSMAKSGQPAPLQAAALKGVAMPTRMRLIPPQTSTWMLLMGLW